MSNNNHLLLLLITVVQISLCQYCSSLCQPSNKANCIAGNDPTLGCITTCATNFFASGPVGGLCISYLTTLSPVSYQNLKNISSTWTISSVNLNKICTVNYTNGPVGNYYIYNFYKKLVGGDYIYKNIPITVPHYQIKIRFAISFIGAWSSRDSIYLNTNDGLQSANYPYSYTCIPGNLTFFICNSAVYVDNNVDCIAPYEQPIFHNTTSMLFNFTFISGQTDSNIKFWNLYDFLIVAVKCSSLCATCYNGSANTCFSCINGAYLTPNNTCTATCTSPLYILPSPTNSLTGQCVSACPQGYYLNGTTCSNCPTSCLVCNSATICTLYASDPYYQSLWTKYLGVWILLIILFIFLIIAVIWRCCFYSRPILPVQQAKVIFEQKVYEERVSVNQTMQKQNDINFHIEDIDYQDHVMVDQNPRRRKRLQQDMFRTRSDF